MCGKPFLKRSNLSLVARILNIMITYPWLIDDAGQRLKFIGQKLPNILYPLVTALIISLLIPQTM